jgi:hypothetical protein
MYAHIFGQEFLEKFRATLAGEPPVVEYGGAMAISEMDEEAYQALLADLTAKGEHRMAACVPNIRPRTAAKAWEDVIRQDVFINTFMDEWRRLCLDAVIAPGVGLPSMQHTKSATMINCISYTLLFNLLNFPCGAFPVTSV